MDNYIKVRPITGELSGLGKWWNSEMTQFGFDEIKLSDLNQQKNPESGHKVFIKQWNENKKIIRK